MVNQAILTIVCQYRILRPAVIFFQSLLILLENMFQIENGTMYT